MDSPNDSLLSPWVVEGVLVEVVSAEGVMFLRELRERMPDEGPSTSQEFRWGGDREEEGGGVPVSAAGSLLWLPEALWC